MVKKRTQQHKKSRFISLMLVVIALVCVAAWAFHIGPFHKSKAGVTESQFTKGEPSQGSTNSTSAGGTSPTAATQSQKNNTTSAVLVVPTGDFVSDHHPNLSGSPAPNTMSSVCNTTPGASCQISFTKDGVVKSLPAQVADAGGSTYWNWKLQDYGLTAGSWQIQAIATLNGQTKSAPDAQDMVVTP